MRQLLQDVRADLDVLEQRARELLLADHPVRLPVVDDADAKAARVNFLSHYASFFLRGVRFGLAAGTGSATTATGAWATLIVIWQVRLRMRATRPRARARQRFSVGPSST